MLTSGNIDFNMISKKHTKIPGMTSLKMPYLLFSTVPEDGLTLLVGFRPLPTKAYTMLVPEFEKHPIFAEFGRKTLQ